MIYIPATSEQMPSARRLAKDLPRSLSVCIREYQSKDDPVADELERPVQAFLSAAERIQSNGNIWVLDPTLVVGNGKELARMFTTLTACDLAVHVLGNERDSKDDRYLSADVVGFASSLAGFVAFATWVHLCLTYEDEPCVENPSSALLARVCEDTYNRGGDVIQMQDIPLEIGLTMWPEVR